MLEPTHQWAGNPDTWIGQAFPCCHSNWDGGGGISNNSWPWFNAWVQGEINSGRLRTMITEFGWNPGRMRYVLNDFETCDKRQHLPWYGSNTLCPAGDGLTHYFQNDLARFLSSQRHGAEVVAVWIIRGWTDDVDGQSRAEGLTTTGTVRTWLHEYQWSNP